LARGAILLGVSAFDEPRRGGAGRTVAAVLLALAVLAVLGGVFGYLLGNKAKDEAGGDGGPSAGPGRSTPAGDPCPSFIQNAARAKGAKAPLTLRLYMTTQKSEVWICTAADGRLWYQGHSMRPARYRDGELPVEGVNGLLLGNVNGIDQGRYRAVNQDANGQTTYTVSKDELVIERNGKKSTEPAVNP
jgi:hypothetical protein